MKPDGDLSARPRICFVFKPSPQHYKLLDLRLLSGHFDTVVHEYGYRPGNIKRFLSKARESDLVFAWFASPWIALISFFLTKRTKLVIVAGGYDVANCKELKHGARFHPIRAWLTRRVLKRADAVLPVSAFNEGEMLTFVRPKWYRTVYNAVDFPEFSLLPGIERKPKVITVGIIGQFISKCKGHLRFLEVARALQQFEFVLMGKATDRTVETLRESAPDNVTIIDYTSRQAMIDELLSASVYLQLSYYESFGVSVAEAIACGCYPIVADGTALPEVVCGQGEVVDAGDVELVACRVEEATEKQLYRSVSADAVRDAFSVGRREAGLLDAIRHVST